MRKICILIVYCFINLFANNIFFDEKIIIENGTKYIAKNIFENNRRKTVIEKITQSQSFRIFEMRPSSSIIDLFINNNLLYFVCADISYNKIIKINKNTTGFSEWNYLKLPIKRGLDYINDFSIYKKNILISITEIYSDYQVNSDEKIYQCYLYQSISELWIPLNSENQEVYEDARSAIEYWFYNGNLKRWYPENRRGEIDKEIWFEQTPTTELRNYPIKLWSKEEKGEKINYPEEYKKKFSEERERLRFEEEKRIAEEKQKLHQKIFIVLGILFLIILVAFLIKKRKKKKIINDKNV